MTRGLALRGHAELVDGLRFRLRFELFRAPFPVELAGLLQVIEEVLFFTGCLNLELYSASAPHHVTVRTATKVQRHELTSRVELLAEPLLE